MACYSSDLRVEEMYKEMQKYASLGTRGEDNEQVNMNVKKNKNTFYLQMFNK